MSLFDRVRDYLGLSDPSPRKLPRAVEFDPDLGPPYASVNRINDHAGGCQCQPCILWRSHVRAQARVGNPNAMDLILKGTA